jgi:hypothetical protein
MMEMELTEEERQLILQRRSLKRKEEEDRLFQQNALKVASMWIDWSARDGSGLTFSTFVNEFGYDGQDGKEMFSAVERILVAAKRQSR